MLLNNDRLKTHLIVDMAIKSGDNSGYRAVRELDEPKLRKYFFVFIVLLKYPKGR